MVNIARATHITTGILFISGAIPISPAIYGGNPAPVLFSGANCASQANFDQERFRVLNEGLPERLTNCDFNLFGSPPSFLQPRLVGVQCDGKCRYILHPRMDGMDLTEG